MTDQTSIADYLRRCVPEWPRRKICEVGIVQAGRQRSPHLQQGSLRPYLRVANVFDGRIDTHDILAMPFTDEEYVRYQLKNGDILLNEGQSLELVGRAAMYEGLPPDCCFQNTLVRFRPGSEIDGAFALALFRYFQKTGVFSEIATQTTSIAHLGVSRFGSLEIALPPLTEQTQIATSISSVEKAIDASQAVIDQLQVVKKAMMAESLTRGLPGRHTEFRQTQIGEIPAEWNLSELVSVATVQTGVAKGKIIENGIELPYLRVANVQDGFVDLSEMKCISVTQDQAERFALQSGDVLFTEGGDADKLGRGCVWRGQINPCLHQNHVFSVRTDRTQLLPEFLSYWGASPGGKSYFLDCAKQTTNLASINSSQLKALPVPLPGLDEQEKICAAIGLVDERMLDERTALGGLLTLKSTLLSTLLTGELRVTPDPEPAP